MWEMISIHMKDAISVCEMLQVYVRDKNDFLLRFFDSRVLTGCLAHTLWQMLHSNSDRERGRSKSTRSGVAPSTCIPKIYIVVLFVSCVLNLFRDAYKSRAEVWPLVVWPFVYIFCFFVVVGYHLLLLLNCWHFDLHWVKFREVTGSVLVLSGILFTRSREMMGDGDFCSREYKVLRTSCTTTLVRKIKAKML